MGYDNLKEGIEMVSVNIKILNKEGVTKAVGRGGERMATLFYGNAYEEGDLICIEFDRPGRFCMVQLDEALQPAMLYVEGKSLSCKVPFGVMRLAISPKAFAGSYHVLQVRLAEPWEVTARRNLCLNPLDGMTDSGVYPHAEANIETRGEIVFAARNAIDGIYCNQSHGGFPYGSWGINRREDACLKVLFGRTVRIDAIELTLRSDYPHDSWWESVEVAFSDGSVERLTLCKDMEPQTFRIASRETDWILLRNMHKAADESPFPALTQIAAYGCDVIEEE